MSEGKIKVYDRRLSNREIADLLPLSPERQRERDMLVEEQNLLKQCLAAMPVGYIPTHTAENLPEMIGDLAKALAEETTERENLELELASVKERQKTDSQSCPECDALASYGSNDGPCETHKL
jgi:predicted RNase H-like nuclease (RuvC/YqgF family)